MKEKIEKKNNYKLATISTKERKRQNKGNNRGVTTLESKIKRLNHTYKNMVCTFFIRIKKLYIMLLCF